VVLLLAGSWSGDSGCRHADLAVAWVGALKVAQYGTLAASACLPAPVHRDAGAHNPKVAGSNPAPAGEVYIDHLEYVMERKRTTIADYRGYLRKHLGPFIGSRPMDKIDCARVEAYLLAKKRDGYSAKTIQNHLNFLNGIWAFSMKRDWVTVNPVLLVDRPRTPRSAHRRLRFLTNEDLAAVVRAVPDDELGAVERPLYACAAMTGLRQGELIGLRWLDVDWVAGRIRVAESYTRGAFDSPKSHADAASRCLTSSQVSSSATSSERGGAATATSSSRTR